MTIQDLFLRVKHTCATDEEYLYELLKFRGFLLENCEGGVRLSDNSHNDDKKFLLNFIGAFGSINKDGIICLHKQVNTSLIENDFIQRIKIPEEVTRYKYRTWVHFNRRHHGHKVSVRVLEPFIARYIKAISACGVMTIGCCDGNHPSGNHTLIQFDGLPSAIWHKLIVVHVLNQFFPLPWDNSCSCVKFNLHTKYDIYYELNRAAEFLYDYRLAFREIKQKVFSTLDSDYFVKMRKADKEIYFIEHAKPLLYEFANSINAD